MFGYHTQEASHLRIRHFDGATVAWLSFIGTNRRDELTDGYDIVQGPVANLDTMPALKLHFAGVYSEEEDMKRLVPQKPHHQHAFKTEKALGLLAFSEVIPV